MRRSLAVAAAATALGVGLTAAGVPSAFAAETCPAGKYCLYDNADYTKLLIASSERHVRWIGAEHNDKVSAVVNNTTEALHLHKDVNWTGYITTISKGQKWSIPADKSNVLSSYYLY